MTISCTSAANTIAIAHDLLRAVEIRQVRPDRMNNVRPTTIKTMGDHSPNTPRRMDAGRRSILMSKMTAPIATRLTGTMEDLMLVPKLRASVPSAVVDHDLLVFDVRDAARLRRSVSTRTTSAGSSNARIPAVFSIWRRSLTCGTIQCAHERSDQHRFRQLIGSCHCARFPSSEPHQ